MGGSLLLALGSPGVEFDSGSWNVHGDVADAIGLLSTALGFVVVVVFWTLVWRYPGRVGAPPLAYAACVAVVLVLGKVVSPQFLLWLVPLAAVVRGRCGLTVCGLLAVACVLTQLVYPWKYEELVDDDTGVVALLVVRNALLIAVAAILGGALWRRIRTPGVSDPPLPVG